MFSLVVEISNMWWFLYATVTEEFNKYYWVCDWQCVYIPTFLMMLLIMIFKDLHSMMFQNQADRRKSQHRIEESENIGGTFQEN